MLPNVRWEVVNQATIHSYTKEEPYTSLEHAMTRWAEIATAVAVYLDEHGKIRYHAPHGLDDLMSMTIRPHLVTPKSRDVYLDRIANKGWQKKWPKITILMPD